MVELSRLAGLEKQLEELQQEQQKEREEPAMAHHVGWLDGVNSCNNALAITSIMRAE